MPMMTVFRVFRSFPKPRPEQKSSVITMSEPDELYTLRAQYWLGHYQLALEEAKSVARRPMSPNLKAEREELLARIHIALRQYDKAQATDTPGT
jgi:coatomer protein complex subunit epsilon